MPNYPGTSGSSTLMTAPIALAVPSALMPGDSTYLFGIVPAANARGSDATIRGEQPGVPQASMAICLAAMGAISPPTICFEISFYATGTLIPAAPGAFEIDLQEADTDADAFYIMPAATPYKITTVIAATQKARVDLSPTGGRFLRALLVSRANAVDVVVKVTRLA